MKIIKNKFKYFSIVALLSISNGSILAQEEAWHPSKYGADDEIGAANLMNNESVLKASKLVTEGKTYSLGIEIGRQTPGFGSREFDITITMPNQFGGQSLGDNGMSYVDDLLTGWLGLGTQIDSLAHLGIDHVFYNGNIDKDFVNTTGVLKMGIHTIPPIVGRGIVLDIASLKGKERLEEGEFISLEDVQKAVELSKLTLSEGDIVILHTGWLSMLYEDPQAFAKGEPGIDKTSAKWLAEQGVVAVGADTWGLDVVPAPDGSLFTAHQELLAKNGVFILENIDTRELIKDDVTEFLFVLGQPKYTGAVQAIINPIGIR